MLVDAFENPQRFRFNTVGKTIRQDYGSDLAGRFADEIAPKHPLAFFTAQASATIEARAPTFFIASATSDRGPAGDARLLLPMWGNGRIEMMLGAVANAAKA